MQAERALDAGQFFDLVEAVLGPPMAALGYHRIQGFLNDQPGSRSSHTSTGGEPAAAPFLWFEYGFEAGSDEVRRLVGPEDPESHDELWVNYEPAAGLLELGAWELVVGERVDWDIWRDDGPCTPSEVTRRLTAVGQAIRAFVDERGSFPIA